MTRYRVVWTPHRGRPVQSPPMTMQEACARWRQCTALRRAEQEGRGQLAITAAGGGPS